MAEFEYPQLFKPVIGETYRNHGGGTFRCLFATDFGASFINTKSGWVLHAHGVRRYSDGTIEWDWSRGDGFDLEALKEIQKLEAEQQQRLEAAQNEN